MGKALTRAELRCGPGPFDDVYMTRTSVLMKYVNPFDGCWHDIESPIAIEEVTKALRSQALSMPPERAWCVGERLSASQMKIRRREHVRKVAWFVRNGFMKPIALDVGVPSLGYFVSHKVVDGNHRLAAAIYRHEVMGEDPLLPTSVSGSMQYAAELGLAPPLNARQDT